MKTKEQHRRAIESRICGKIDMLQRARREKAEKYKAMTREEKIEFLARHAADDCRLAELTFDDNDNFHFSHDNGMLPRGWFSTHGRNLGWYFCPADGESGSAAGWTFGGESEQEARESFYLEEKEFWSREENKDEIPAELPE